MIYKEPNFDAQGISPGVLWSRHLDSEKWVSEDPVLNIVISKDKVTGKYRWSCDFDKSLKATKEALAESNLDEILAEVSRLIPEFFTIREDE